MDAVTFQWIVTGLMGLVLWFGKRLLDEQAAKMIALELDAANIRATYIHKDNFKEFKEELKTLLAEIKQDIKEIKFHAG